MQNLTMNSAAEPFRETLPRACGDMPAGVIVVIVIVMTLLTLLGVQVACRWDTPSPTINQNSLNANTMVMITHF